MIFTRSILGSSTSGGRRRHFTPTGFSPYRCLVLSISTITKKEVNEDDEEVLIGSVTHFSCAQSVTRTGAWGTLHRQIWMYVRCRMLERQVW